MRTFYGPAVGLEKWTVCEIVTIPLHCCYFDDRLVDSRVAYWWLVREAYKWTLQRGGETVVSVRRKKAILLRPIGWQWLALVSGNWEATIWLPMKGTKAQWLRGFSQGGHGSWSIVQRPLPSRAAVVSSVRCSGSIRRGLDPRLGLSFFFSFDFHFHWSCCFLSHVSLRSRVWCTRHQGHKRRRHKAQWTDHGWTVQDARLLCFRLDRCALLATRSKFFHRSSSWSQIIVTYNTSYEIRVPLFTSVKLCQERQWKHEQQDRHSKSWNGTREHWFWRAIALQWLEWRTALTRFYFSICDGILDHTTPFWGVWRGFHCFNPFLRRFGAQFGLVVATARNHAVCANGKVVSFLILGQSPIIDLGIFVNGSTNSIGSNSFFTEKEQLPKN